MQNLKNSLKLRTLKTLKNDLISGNHYLFLASTISDNSVISDTISESNSVLHDLISAYKILPGDVAYAIELNPWESDTIYDEYTDDVNLKNKNFYVTIENTAYNHLDVFVCVSNNDKSVSTEMPYSSTGNDLNFIITSDDNYVWKHMYRLIQWKNDPFTTNTHVKIQQNIDTYSASNFGGIEKIKITKIGGIFPKAVNLNLNSDFNITTQNLNTKTLTLSTDSLQSTIAKDSGATATYNDDYMIYLYNPTTHEFIASYTIDTYSYSSTQISLVTCESMPQLPNLTGSLYKILPKLKLNGNGTGLTVIPNIDPNTLQIESIDIVDSGSGYSDLQITSINGYEYRPIYSLEGGLGFDILRDLNCSELIIKKEINATNKGIYESLTTPNYNETETLTIGSSESSLISGESKFNINVNYMPAMEDNQIYKFGLIYNNDSSNFTTNNLTTIKGCSVVTIWQGENINVPNILDDTVNNFNINDLICQTDVSGNILAYGRVISVKYYSYPEGDVPELSESQFNDVKLKCARPKIVVKMYKGQFLTSNGLLKIYDINNNTTQESAWKVYNKVESDIIKNKGIPLYIENTDPISLSSDSTANFKVIISI